MACYHPIPAHQDHHGGPVTLWPPVGTATVNLPCGNCLGCRTDRATLWARRAEHEASRWTNNSFLTLTYDNSGLPQGGHLDRRDLTLFLKRLRRANDRQTATIISLRTFRHTTTTDHAGQEHTRTTNTTGIRYLACGEYGDHTQRPHYHIILFNCGFSDARLVGKNLYESPTLAKLWTKGAHRLGEVSGASANYVAQYTLKKLAHREEPDADGVIRPAPFIAVSLKPAIGARWLETYKTDLQHGYLVTDGKKGAIPRTYKRMLAKSDPQLAEQATERARQHKRTAHDKAAAERIHERRNQLARQRKL